MGGARSTSSLLAIPAFAKVPSLQPSKLYAVMNERGASVPAFHPIHPSAHAHPPALSFDLFCVLVALLHLISNFSPHHCFLSSTTNNKQEREYFMPPAVTKQFSPFSPATDVGQIQTKQSALAKLVMSTHLAAAAATPDISPRSHSPPTSAPKVENDHNHNQGNKDGANNVHNNHHSAYSNGTSLGARPPPGRDAAVPAFGDLPPPAAVAAMRVVRDLTDTPPFPRSSNSTAPSSPRM
jgi:hypothetical protein